MHMRLAIAGVLAILVTGCSLGVPRGADSSITVTFRLTMEGRVPETESFSLLTRARGV